MTRNLLTYLLTYLHCGNTHFRPICWCDLDLDPMTFVYKLDPYCMKIYQMSETKHRTSRLLKVIV